MTDDVWDEPTAAAYDESISHMFDPAVLEPTVDLLADVAGGRPALELAVGTGRVAIPLSGRGVDVTGIELSEAMVAELRTRPGAERVDVVIGDMATTRVPGEFGLVYLVFNTITNLLTQDEQVACFENAASHLRPGGHFLIETFVPALRRLPVTERFVAFEVSEHRVGVDEYDVVAQRLVSHHYDVDAGSSFRSVHRYAWPAEYDLMARIAGLRFHARWADWGRREFTGTSSSHVSVWRRPPA